MRASLEIWWVPLAMCLGATGAIGCLSVAVVEEAVGKAPKQKSWALAGGETSRVSISVTNHRMPTPTLCSSRGPAENEEGGDLGRGPARPSSTDCEETRLSPPIAQPGLTHCDHVEFVALDGTPRALGANRSHDREEFVIAKSGTPVVVGRKIPDYPKQIGMKLIESEETIVSYEALAKQCAVGIGFGRAGGEGKIGLWELIPGDFRSLQVNLSVPARAPPRSPRPRYWLLLPFAIAGDGVIVVLWFTAMVLTGGAIGPP